MDLAKGIAMLSRETIELAAQFDKQDAALKKANQDRAALEKAETKRHEKFKQELAKHDDQFVKIQAAYTKAGRAKREIFLAVPEEVRAKLDRCEVEQRATAERLKTAQGKVRDLTAAMERMRSVMNSLELASAKRQIVETEAAEAEAQAEAVRAERSLKDAKLSLDAALAAVVTAAKEEHAARAVG